jgi:hypothetical protein
LVNIMLTYAVVNAYKGNFSFIDTPKNRRQEWK